MATLKAMLTIFAVAALVATSAVADTYEFTGTNGDSWHDPDNWDPNTGPPGGADTAIIPSGETCRIVDYDEQAKNIQVSGTLGIVGKSLVLGTFYTPTTSTVDGTVYFEKVSSTKGNLLVKDVVTIDGSGTLTASKYVDTDYEGVIGLYVIYPYVFGEGLVLGAGMTLKGSLAIDLSLELQKDGETEAAAILDYAGDTMTLGQTAHGVLELQISGAGRFDVTAGKLLVRAVELTSTTPRWVLSGGEIEIYDLFDNSTFTGLTVQLTMSGGTFDINDYFSTTGTLEFSGGTIELAHGRTAAFE